MSDSYLEPQTIYIMIIISLGINCLILLLMAQLICLHIWLYLNKMTTYENIIAKREKIKAKLALKNAENQQVMP